MGMASISCTGRRRIAAGLAGAENDARDDEGHADDSHEVRRVGSVGVALWRGDHDRDGGEGACLDEEHHAHEGDRGQPQDVVPDAPQRFYRQHAL
jgi:hypothetical protein